MNISAIKFFFDRPRPLNLPCETFDVPNEAPLRGIPMDQYHKPYERLGRSRSGSRSQLRALFDRL